MRLATRMKLTYGTVFIVPLILMFVTFWGMGQIEMRALRQKFDMEEASVEMLVNPYKMLDKISSSIVDELRNTAENSPEKLMDTAYLEQMNQRLEAYSSFLVLRRGGEVYYSGGPGDTGLELSNLELFTVDSGFVSGEEPYHLKQIDFGFSDGSEGVVQILTPVESVVHQVENMIVKAFVLALIILVAVSGTAFFGLYQSIVQPLEKLKRAAVNIKEGNLDFNVITDTEDEIGEVCTAFEEMRIKLKAQIDLSMQYEKDNKELISNISHDLKTPITAIKGYVEGIRDDVADTPEKMDKYIRTIYNKATDMDKLIDEPIDFISGQIEEFERRRVEAKKAMICEIYTGIMAEHGTVMEYLPLDRIYDSRWENSTTTQKAITEAITAHVEHVEKDLDTIRAMESEFEDKGLAKYKATLELSDAITAMNQYQKQKEEILRRQAEEEQRKAALVHEEPAAPEVVPEVVPEEEKEVRSAPASAGTVRYEVVADPFQIAQLEAAMREYGIKFRRV